LSFVEIKLKGSDIVRFIGMLRETKGLYYDRPIIIEANSEDDAVVKVKEYFMKNGTNLDTEDADYELTYVDPEEKVFLIS
jgi:hypothetical protein